MKNRKLEGGQKLIPLPKYRCQKHRDQQRSFLSPNIWDGKSFVHLEKVAKNLDGLKSAAAIRPKLMTLIKHFPMLIVVMPLVSGIVACSSSARQNRLSSETQLSVLAPQAPEQSSSQPKPGTIESPAPAVLDEEQTRDWKTYRHPSLGFTFRYPQNTVLSLQGNRIKLQHSIRFKHLDPCDYRSDSKLLSRLVDFAVGLEVVRSKDTGKKRRPGANQEPGPAAPVEQSNTGDSGSFAVGSLKGEFDRISVEGCGEYRYRFPLAGSRILLVRREIIGIFSPTAQKFVNEEIVLKQPGIISPEQEQRFFNTILSTFKLAETK